VQNLDKSFQYGFDNYATVLADPDLKAVQSTPELDLLWAKYDPKGKRRNRSNARAGGGFNPFGFLGGNQ